jgi:hypothetical protein
MQTADDLFGGPQGSPRTDKLIAASVQWARLIMGRWIACAGQIEEDCTPVSGSPQSCTSQVFAFYATRYRERYLHATYGHFARNRPLDRSRDSRAAERCLPSANHRYTQLSHELHRVEYRNRPVGYHEYHDVAKLLHPTKQLRAEPRRRSELHHRNPLFTQSRRNARRHANGSN